MHHPGPPRFVAVGDEVELAPRDPDPGAAYDWRVAAAPADSEATVGDDPVEWFQPDVPGRYHLELSAPDGIHRLTVRAFPGELGAEFAEGAYGSAGALAEPLVGDAAADDAAAYAGRPDGEEETDSDDGTRGPGGRPRLRLSATAADDAILVRATARPHPDGSETAADLDVEFLLDDRDDLARADVAVEGHELSIPLDRLPERARVHAAAVGAGGYSVPDAVDLRRDADGSVTVEQPYDPPEWAEDAIIYEIYVRTFPGQGDPRSGGLDPAERAAGEAGSDAERAAEADGRSVFDAIVERLDYIADLGADTIWLTPVLENDHAPHGYNVTDFLSIAADLGSREDYERLIEEAHDRDVRVLFDLVCNHSGRAHPYFQAAVADPDSEYREWYEWRGPGEPETYFDWEHIANFDFTHLPVRRHLLDVVDEWAPLVDGFRCDMAWAVPDGFWREVHDRCKALDSEFLLLDETIPYIAEFQAGLFDVHFDSTTYAALRRVGNGEDAEAVIEAVDERARAGFPDHAGFMLYAENHDETRYLVECGRPAARAALAALFTLPGAPMVYAGQEFGQRGKRDDLAWDHADEDLREHARRLAAARADVPALAADADLRRVDYEVREGWDDRVVAFARRAGGGAGGADHDPVVVVLNFGEASATVDVGPATGDTDLVTGEPLAGDDGLRVDDVVVVPADPGSVPR